MSLQIETIALGPMKNLCYILRCTMSKKSVIVDPAWDPSYLVYKAKREEYTLESVFLTHGHFDHINGLNWILEHNPSLPVYASAKEPFPADTPQSTFIYVEENDTVPCGNKALKILDTPGHSPGSICFLFDPILITGDVLFIGACGRSDLPGSNPDDLFQSLQKLKALPDHLQIYCGHDYGSSQHDLLGNQKQKNPYLNVSNKEDFLRKRVGF